MSRTLHVQRAFLPASLSVLHIIYDYTAYAETFRRKPHKSLPRCLNGTCSGKGNKEVDAAFVFYLYKIITVLVRNQLDLFSLAIVYAVKLISRLEVHFEEDFFSG